MAKQYLMPLFTICAMLMGTGIHSHALDISTFLGGAGDDYATDLVIDGTGNIVICGLTGSSDFPVTAGAYGTTYVGGSFDIFVLKLSADLNTLLASTFIGGTDADGNIEGDFKMTPTLLFEDTGNYLLAGETYSDDFPTTPGAYDTTHNTYWQEAFLLRLSPDLDSLMASTLVGGMHMDRAFDIEFDSSGDILMTGETRSDDFPVTAGAFDETFNGDLRDMFVCKLSSDLSSLMSSTYLGGAVMDKGRDILLDDSDAVYLTGYSNSDNFPTTPGAFDEIFNGPARDCTVTKLSSDLSSVIASTFLGGTVWAPPQDQPRSKTDYQHEGGCDEGYGITFDNEGNLVVVGATHSYDFPITSGAVDSIYNDGESIDYEGFVARFTPDLSTLINCTFLGGRHVEKVLDPWIDAHGNIVVSGKTRSLDFPVSNGSYDLGYNSGTLDAFITKLSPELDTIYYSTFLGGSDEEYATAMALDGNDQAYVAGYTLSANFPVTPGSYDDSHNGSIDAFVCRFNVGTVSTGVSCTPVSGTLPFTTTMNCSVTNQSPESRRMALHLDAQLAGGRYITNFKAGFTILGSAESYEAVWGQSLPGYSSLVGSNTFLLFAEDVTEAPYNQPPYPPSGDMDTDQTIVTCATP